MNATRRTLMKQGWKKTTAALFLLSSMAVLAAVILAACGTAATPTPASQAEAYVSSNLETSYEGALPATTQLILGTLLLEGTTDAITPEQASTLLPLWQVLQGTALQNQSEVNAVLGQIERAMTAEQLQSIAAMQLTQESMAAWAQKNGMDMGQWAGGPGGTPGAMGPGGANSEARETMRAGFDSVSEEERAQMRATMQAGGMPAGGPGGAGGFGGRPEQSGASTGQFRFLLPPLIELLTQRVGS
jgi:hypothetical protein